VATAADAAGSVKLLNSVDISRVCWERHGVHTAAANKFTATPI